MKLILMNILVALCLSACGFTPLHGQHNTNKDSQTNHVAIALIPDREGQILRNALIDRLYQNGMPQDTNTTLSVSKITEVRSDLDITKSSEATRSQLTLTAQMTLTDNNGTKLLQRDLRTVTSFNVLGSEFATRITEDSARQSALEDLARQIELQLGLYLAQP